MALSFTSDKQAEITRLEVAAREMPGLFAQVAGVLALSGATILDARIDTRKDGVVIDRFGIQDLQGRPFDETRRQNKLRERLRDAVNGELDIAKALQEARRRTPQPAEKFEQEPKVFIDNFASEQYSVIEVQGLDQLGLLHRIFAYTGLAGADGGHGACGDIRRAGGG